MGKKTLAIGEAEGSPRKKSPRLDLQRQALVAAAVAATQEVSDPMEEDADGTRNRNPCDHRVIDSARKTLMSSLLSVDAGKCVGCRLEDEKGAVKHRPEKSSILICLQCGQHFCCGVGGIVYPFGHSRAHAMENEHWVAALHDDAPRGYCFKCNAVVEMPAEIEVDMRALKSQHEIHKLASVPGMRERWEGNGVNKQCNHVPTHRVHKGNLSLPLGRCDYCGLTEGRIRILVCLECSWKCCAGHAQGHAEQKQHWFAVVFKSPEVGFCFKCKAEVDVDSGEIRAEGRASGFGVVPCPSMDFSSIVPGVMGKVEKSSQLDLLAKVAAPPTEVDEEWPDPEQCNHIPNDSAHKIFSLSLQSDNLGNCEDCQIKDKPVGNRILVCLECGRQSCGDDLNTFMPYGHAEEHAKQEQHWVAMPIDETENGFCFKCEVSVPVYPDPEDMTVGIQSSGHAFGSDVAPVPILNPGDTVYGKEFVSANVQGYAIRGSTNVQGYAIKGIPNRLNTCYMSAMVQCLLVLDKLQAMMLGPDPPPGHLGLALKELFVKASAADAVGGTLNPDELLKRVRLHDDKFKANCMHDSHELLESLRNALQNEENRIQTPYRKKGAPTVIDSIFRGEVSETLSCICCQSTSVVYDSFCELSMALPSKEVLSRSDASPQIIKSSKSQPKQTATQLLPENESNSVKIEAVVKSADSHLLGSEMKDVVVEKTPEPLEVDSAKAQHIWQSKDAIQDPLQAEEDKFTCSELPEWFIEVSLKCVSSIPCKKSVVKAEQTIGTAADSHSPEDDIVASLSENDAQKATGSYVDQNDNGDSGDILNQLEVSIQAKECASTVQLIDEDKGYARSRDIVYDKDVGDMNSVPSIEDCLSLFFQKEVVERSCSCYKVPEKPSTNQSENSNSTVESINDEVAVDWGQIEQSDRTTRPNEQPSDSLSVERKLSSSRQQDSSDAESEIIQAVDIDTNETNSKMSCGDKELKCLDGIQEPVSSLLPPEKQLLNVQHSQIPSTPNQDSRNRLVLDLSASQLGDNQNEQKEKSEHAIQKTRITKLPPVLTLHLKRYIHDGDVSHKIQSHVSYKEYLDVGQFMDSSSVDRDNSRYRLAGVVEHQGAFMNSGHYVAYVRPRRLEDQQQQSSSSSSWFCADDTTISQVTLEEVLEREAYIVFYERMER